MATQGWVKESVKYRANGCCEICGFFCPPILQFHHVIPLSRDGWDAPDNIAHICPNCHATIHSMAPGNEKKAYYVYSWLESFMDDHILCLLSEFTCGRPKLIGKKWCYKGINGELISKDGKDLTP